MKSKAGLSFDIIVTDYQMPVLTGLDLAEKVRTYYKYNHIPIVLVTQASYITFGFDVRYKVFDKILHKPITKDFITEIENVLLEKNKNK
ncbi:MAG: CheY-like chemotaxis protein [Candidatus Midichloriaceae bacterium]|jgi:CheY-like chemotaxis protein